ncbi:MAG: molybdopterin-synthase adenylyltransferase MoeB [Gemmatimonadales bacterium]
MSNPAADLIRYARHLTLPGVGVAGQEKLRAARVLIVGVGGLGSPAALYLSAAGVGTLGLVDSDQVDLTNLQRQIIHGTGRIGQPKLDSAADRLADLNPTTRLELHPVRLSSANAIGIISGYDVVLDGSDNFPTRYLVNDAAVLAGKPFVYGSILRFEGQVSVFGSPGGPCYRCLFAEPPPAELVPNCAEAGVLGVLPGVVGTLQATEVLKLILGIGEPLVGRLLLYDGLAARTREVAVRRDRSCAVCGDQPTVTSLIDYEAFCGVADHQTRLAELPPSELAAWIESGVPLELIDVREPWETAIGTIPGSRLIPLAGLPDQLSSLDPRRLYVTVCHHGQRSLAAQSLLEGAGFEARSLEGGVDAWSRDIDPSLPRY